MTVKDAIAAREAAKKPKPAPESKKAKKVRIEPVEEMIEREVIDG